MFVYDVAMAAAVYRRSLDGNTIVERHGHRQKNTAIIIDPYDTDL